MSHNWARKAAADGTISSKKINWKQAIYGPDRDLWKSAGEAVLESLKNHNTWLDLKPDDYPVSTQPLGSRFLCKINIIGSNA